MIRAPRSLRRRWWLIAAAFALATAVVGLTVAREFGRGTAVTWLGSTVVPLGYVLWFLRRSLGWNHPPEDAAIGDGGVRARPALGVANGLTLTRGWLYAGVAGFLLVVPPTGSGWRWVPAALYGSGVALDWIDGFVADTVGRRTALGRKLDMAFDTMGFLVAPLVAVAWGRLPVWYLSLSAARYAFRFGCWTRRRRGRPIGDLPSSRIRRPLAGFQMAFVAVALLPVVPVEVVRPAAAVALVPSLATFARDYLAVTTGRGGDDRGTEPGRAPATPREVDEDNCHTGTGP